MSNEFTKSCQLAHIPHNDWLISGLIDTAMSAALQPPGSRGDSICSHNSAGATCVGPASTSTACRVGHIHSAVDSTTTRTRHTAQINVQACVLHSMHAHTHMHTHTPQLTTTTTPVATPRIMFNIRYYRTEKGSPIKHISSLHIYQFSSSTFIWLSAHVHLT